MGAWNKGRGECYLWLMAHVNYQGDECLTWPFGTCNGYGVFGYMDESHYAHRFLCEIKNGPQPEGNYHAAHSCGNGDKGCVNHNHIAWKTVSGNQYDRTRHGRASTGARGKLTVEQKQEIVALRGYFKQREIAEMYGVTRSRISVILTDRPRRVPRGTMRCGKRWVARIGHGGEDFMLGIFDTEQEAHEFYKEADMKVRSGLHPTECLLKNGMEAEK